MFSVQFSSPPGRSGPYEGLAWSVGGLSGPYEFGYHADRTHEPPDFVELIGQILEYLGTA